MRVRAPARSSRSVASRSADRLLLRVLRQGGVERGKKSGNVGIDAGAQLVIDKRPGALLAGYGVGPGLVSVQAQRLSGTRAGLGESGRTRAARRRIGGRAVCA